MSDLSTAERVITSTDVFPDNGPIKAGVLLSGRGSNFLSIIERQTAGYFQRLQIVCVASDKPQTPGLKLAEPYHITVLPRSAKDFDSLIGFENYIVTEMKKQGVQLLILAGYMRIVSSVLLDVWPSAIVNIHPALLPSFTGLHAQAQAVEHGVKVSGCTVHFVDAGLDSGPIIGQRAVPVEDNDTEETLSARILIREHELYSECLKKITEQKWSIVGRRVIFD